MDLPEGFLYRPDFMQESEEFRILNEIRKLQFSPVVMHGVTAKRRVVHYGMVYGYESYGLVQGTPIPDFLDAARLQSAELMQVDASEIVEALITEYPAGAVIGWHRDAPPFGRIAGISMLSSCRMRFRREEGGKYLRAAIELGPRSAYVLRGAARSQWQHSIPALSSLRYSITFRTVRKNPKRLTDTPDQ